MTLTKEQVLIDQRHYAGPSHFTLPKERCKRCRAHYNSHTQKDGKFVACIQPRKDGHRCLCAGFVV